jgi:mutator protein MutT
MKQLDLTLVYLIVDNKVMLAMKKRGFGKGRWNGAGGKVEASETIEQAMIRECQEEIGIRPINYSKVAQLEFDERHGGERKIMDIAVFTSSKWSGEPRESEEMRPEWFFVNSLPLDRMWPADGIWLPIILSGNKIEAKFRLDNRDNVVSHELRIVDEF